jgi:uncharacterized protein (DUF2147 family)
MKTVYSLCFLLITLLPATQAAAQTAAQGVVDEWWTPGFNARVRLAPCDDKLCGTIIWAWDELPSGAADKRPLLGQRIITGMKPDRNHGYSGSIYNPEDGQTYNASMRLKSANTLLVEGCVLFICKAQVWRRYSSQSCPTVAAGL